MSADYCEEKVQSSIQDLEKVSGAIFPFSRDFCEAITLCNISMGQGDINQKEIEEMSLYEICKDAFVLYDRSNEVLAFRRNGNCGLSPEEQASLDFYVNMGYKCMNNYLRNPVQDLVALEIYKEKLNSALDKFPNYIGVVTRGATMPSEVRKLHKIDSVVTYPAFTSTSTSTAFSGKDIFYIFSRTGKPIMNQGLDEENEVLFKSGTQFKVVSVFNKMDKNYYILIELIPGDRPAIIERFKNYTMKAIFKNTNSSPRSPDLYTCPLSETKKVVKEIYQRNLPGIP